MLFGRVAQERLQLNENTLWAGSPYSPENADALAALPRVRALIDEGRYEDADRLASERMMAKPLSQMSYGSLGDFLLTFSDAAVPVRYERGLDLRDATASVEYQLGAARFRRELFASAPDQVIVLHLEAKGGKMSFALDHRGPREIEQTAPDYAGPATPTIVKDSVDWTMRESLGRLGQDVTVAPDGDGAILITGRNAAGHGIAAGLIYAMRVQVLCDGRVSSTGLGLSVREASVVTLLISAATSYVDYRNIGGDPIATVRAATAMAAQKGYARLRRNHVTDHRGLFDRFTIDLGRTPAEAQSTDARIASAETSDDPALAALYMQFARYLTIASSRVGGQPANLQGLWNEGLNPPWGSKFTININTEMNYWVTAPAALAECAEPLLRMVEDMAVTGAKTARVMYGASGWVAHHNTDLWRATAPIDGPFSGLWPCGGAWLCNTLWDHWDYTRSEPLLTRLYPLLAGASMFFLDTLVEDPKGRGLVTSPSISPENQHPFGSAVCAGPAMDRQIIRDLFDHTLDAGRRLNRDPDLMQRIGETRPHLALDRIGSAGQLQEWLDDWDTQVPDIHHRHVSHLYAVYPSGQINVRDTPQLIAAAKETLRQRGDLTTGWGTAWRTCLWARMGDGEHAHRILRGLLGPQRTYPNLFDAHPPFQIDGNFGGAAAILEMIAQSWGEEVRLLPALPAAWPNGRVTGMRLRGGLSLDLTWQSGKVERFVLRGRPGQGVRLQTADAVQWLVLDAHGRAAMGPA
jgi:alpha-L-fucosidase 2